MREVLNAPPDTIQVTANRLTDSDKQNSTNSTNSTNYMQLIKKYKHCKM